ncbi:ABC transporter G family member 10-like [Rutidosis leptorrhynchoides]|uniref:ABC transporter G family member 10-like n=1 Tax=Rutidosis leptorrhynchoides TaxID=125765 RepID=UPI003A9908BD
MAETYEHGHPKTQYTIRTKSVSYRVSPPYFNFQFICQNRVNPTLKKQILKDVNCQAKPGEITAVAGPSGSGKTTLLEILAGVIRPHRLSGQVVVNGRPMNPNVFRRVSGYVTQDDILFPLLTVEETLLFSARFRLRDGLENAKNRVSELLIELGLTHVAQERIGAGTGSHRGVSGGEKRRVSIGVELVHDPAVLLMDEPTSGLDSASAFHLMSMLKSMAKDHGKTIVLTIHQPGFRILQVFDQVVLLVHGTVVHHGSLNLLDYRLKLAGHVIPSQVNVLEFSIDVVESLFKDAELEAGFGLGLITCRPNEPDHINEGDHDQLLYANSPLNEVLILSQRFCHNLFRSKDIFLAKMILSMLFGILLGTTFKNVHKFEMQTQIGFFAYNLSFLIYSSSEALTIFLQERRILMKETSIGAYRISSYILANTLVFIPFLLIVALLYSIPILMSNSFVLFTSSFVSNFMMGIATVDGLIGLFFLFSGYFISKKDIPKYWIFMHYLSLVKYPFEAFLLNEYGGSEKGKLRCLERFEGGCLVDGEDFLKRQKIKEIQKWHNLGLMIVFIFGYRFLSYLVLSYRSYKTRN